ncbi:DNA primase family protein [Mycolicibacter algericus]|nr:phage/plasmid primase, P4 family [Mycolicibacter algericus]OQZ96931.1 hypothetical protein BST10_10170 [Mycolicibacter algericus DSM 45454]
MTFDELLELLGYTDTEHVGICHQLEGHFNTAVLPSNAATAYVSNLPDTADIWYQVNPTSGPVRTNAGRGTADAVTRLAALWCDLDVKPGGCDTLTVAEQIIDDLAQILGTRPSVVIASGHGLQPYWPIDDAPITETFTVADAAALLHRWGRLVALVADRRGAQVDNVYDLPRILRVPGTINNKTTPVPVTAAATGGGPLTVDEVDERLNEAGIYHEPDPRGTGSEVIAPPGAWAWGTPGMCTYMPTVIAGWKTDAPTSRHPWLVSQAVRLAAAHRNGCLTADQHRDAEKVLCDRFRHLCTTGGDQARKPGPYEIAAALAFGRDRVATMTDARLADELGHHTHLDQLAGGINITTTTPPAPPSNVTPLPTNTGSPATPATDNAELATVTPITKTQTVTLTDSGNAGLLVANCADRLRYCPELGRWLSWDTQRWEVAVDDGQVITAAHTVIESIDTTGDQATAKHKIKSLSKTGLEAMVALARRNPAMRITRDRLDADPYLLNTPSGVIDLRTATLTPHTPHGWHTKITGAAYDRDLPAPRWHQFLHTTFGGDDELIRYVQRLAGYAAIGEVTHHVLPFLFGAGQNGKSVLLDVLVDVLGDYALTAPANFLLAGQTKHETEIARLNGARLVVCSEVNQESRFDEAKIKSLTGGDKITGRFMRQDFFDFTPSHTLFLAGNHQPQVSAGGKSFWRRLRLIPFRHEVPAEQRNENLARELVDHEGPAILAWITAGTVDMLTGGLDEPSSVAAATGEYEEQEDALKRFLDECCHLGGGITVKTKTSVVLARYQRWARENGETEMGAKVLSRELANRFGIRSVASNGVRFYNSVALVSEESEQRWND